jgi:hypothetical protein
VDTINLNLPQYYINRELAQLAFNRRVLHQAQDRRSPLLERLKFLCISSTNLDEFFEIRVAGLKQRVEVSSSPAGPDNMSPGEVLAEIAEATQQIVASQYELLNSELIPALRGEGIQFVRRDEWTPQQRRWLEQHFETEIVPVLSPTTLDPTRPIPRILNRSLNFIVSLDGVDAFGRQCHRAIVQAPRSLPRLIQVPEELCGGNDRLFSGIEITGCYQFRVTRNSDLYVDDEDVDDLMRALEGELFESRYGDAVRLETAHDCPQDLASYLLEHFQLTEDDHYRVPGPVNLNRLLAVYDLVDRPDLKYPPFTPGMPKELVNKNLFEAITARDILLHHPFESFTPVVDFVYRAANDPDVLAIKQTLYRTTPDSPLIESLVSAAKAGKEVTVMIELRARFDEAANIELASKLQEAGAHVVYGIVGYKTHCKIILVVRRENGKLRRYVHLGTGNYHPKTARLYGLRSVHGGSEHRRRCARSLHAADEPDEDREAQATFAVTLRSAHAPARAHPARNAQRAIRWYGAHNCQNQRARGAATHTGPLRSLECRRLYRSHRARNLLPEARHSGHLGEHSRSFHHRPLSRTLALLLLSQRRERGGLLRQRRLDGPEYVPPHRAHVPRARHAAEAARDRRFGSLSGRQHAGLGPEGQRRLPAACGGRRGCRLRSDRAARAAGRVFLTVF